MAVTFGVRGGQSVSFTETAAAATYNNAQLLSSQPTGPLRTFLSQVYGSAAAVDTAFAAAGGRFTLADDTIGVTGYTWGIDGSGLPTLTLSNYGQASRSPVRGTAITATSGPIGASTNVEVQFGGSVVVPGNTLQVGSTMLIHVNLDPIACGIVGPGTTFTVRVRGESITGPILYAGTLTVDSGNDPYIFSLDLTYTQQTAGVGGTYAAAGTGYLANATGQVVAAVSNWAGSVTDTASNITLLTTIQFGVSNAVNAATINQFSFLTQLSDSNIGTATNTYGTLELIHSIEQ